MTGLAHVKRNQLALLADACAASVPLTLALRSGGCAWQTRLCSLSVTELFVLYPRDAHGGALASNTPVEGRFTHGNAVWSFFSSVRGRHVHESLGTLLRLCVPLMLQPGERRQSRRFQIDEQHTVLAQFTSITDSRRSFTAEVFDLSDAGVGATVADAHCEMLVVGDLYWIEVAPTDGGASASFVARAAHRGQCAADRTKFGFEFQGGDNHEAFERNLTRLHGLLSRYVVRCARSAATDSATGVSQC
ncbi:MAG: hypothetical protein ACKVS9_00785 [Phycisphaerae bacterium]